MRGAAALAALVLLPGAPALMAQPPAPAPPAAPTFPQAAAPAVPQAAAPPPRVAPSPPTAPAPPAFPVDVKLAPVVTERAGEVTVGDRVEAILTLRVPEKLSGAPRFPVWGETWGDVEVREKGEPQKVSASGDTAVYRQRLILVPWKPGRIALPPATVDVPLAERTVEARTPADLALDVVSVLPRTKPGEAPPAPKGPAPLAMLPIGTRFLWTAAGLAAACAAAGALLYWRSRRSAAAGAIPALPPYAALMAEIDRLEARMGARLDAEASTLPVHTDLSRALRAYLGRTLGFHAAESTTSEIQRQLTGRRLPGAIPRRTVELLRGCDLVKFARQEAGRERTRERLATGRALGGEIEQYVRPPAPAADAGSIETPFEKKAGPPMR